MFHPAFHISIEVALSFLVILAIYTFQRFRYSTTEHILRLPSNLKLTALAFTTAILLLIYHGYLVATYPTWFLHCEKIHCQFNFLEGIAILAGYHLDTHSFTESGNHSRVIFISINLLAFFSSFVFYLQYLNELRHTQQQLLKLQRKAELLLVRFDNQANDIRDELIDLYVEFDLRKLNAEGLHLAIIHYRDDRSAMNLDRVIEGLKRAASI